MHYFKTLLFLIFAFNSTVFARTQFTGLKPLGMKSENKKSYHQNLLFKYIEEKSLNAGELCRFIAANEKVGNLKHLTNERGEPPYYAAVRVQNREAISCLETIGLAPQNARELNTWELLYGGKKILFSPYEYALAFAPLSFIEELERKGGALLPERVEMGITKFHLAAMANSLEVVSYFYKKLNIRNINSLAKLGDRNILSPLGLAVMANPRPSVIRFLLENGADPLKKNVAEDVIRRIDYGFGRPIFLIAAAYAENANVLEELYRSLDIDIADEENINGLWMAAAFNKNVNVVNFFVDKGAKLTHVAPINISDYDFYMTPLLTAAAFNTLEVVSYLLSTNSDLNYIAPGYRHNKSTALIHLISRRHDLNIVGKISWYKKLKDRGASLNSSDPDFPSLLFYHLDNLRRNGTSEKDVYSVLVQLIRIGVDYKVGNFFNYLFEESFNFDRPYPHQLSKKSVINLASVVNANLNSEVTDSAKMASCAQSSQESFKTAIDELKLNFNFNKPEEIISNCLFAVILRNNSIDRLGFVLKNTTLNPKGINSKGDSLITAMVRATNYEGALFQFPFHANQQATIRLLKSLGVNLGQKSFDGETALSLAQKKSEVPEATLELLKF